MTTTPAVASTTTRCPKCGHVRSAAATAPAWQCPACGIAYNKYNAPLARMRQATVVPRAGDAVPRWSGDGSIWVLLLVNIATLVVAVYDHWSTVALMAAYWAQSVIIGIANVFRMLALDKFSTENFRVGGKAVDPTPAVKRQTASFFALHYGIFHLAYLAFLLKQGKSGQVFDGWFWACTAAFALNHLWSYRYNTQLDRQGTPNIGTLMFTPYLRVLPMHFTIVIGALFITSSAGMILFGVLKILADVAMHLIEHAQLRKVRSVHT